MNRTAFAARLTADELTAELSMYAGEMTEHLSNLEGWDGYRMYQALQHEQDTRRAQQAARADMQRYGWEDGRPVEFEHAARAA